MASDPDMITGIMFRVRRDGTWSSLDIATLTDQELIAALSIESPAFLRRTALLLAQWIRDNVKKESA